MTSRSRKAASVAAAWRKRAAASSTNASRRICPAFGCGGARLGGRAAGCRLGLHGRRGCGRSGGGGLRRAPSHRHPRRAASAGGGARQPLPALGRHRGRKGDVARLERRIVDASAAGLGQRLQHEPARIAGDALDLAGASAQPEAPQRCYRIARRHCRRPRTCGLMNGKRLRFRCRLGQKVGLLMVGGTRRGCRCHAGASRTP